MNRSNDFGTNIFITVRKNLILFFKGVIRKEISIDFNADEHFL